MRGSYPALCGSIAGRPGPFGVAMHNAAYRALGIDYTYVAFAGDDTAGVIEAVRCLGIRGLGVSMPHKIAVMEHLDHVDDVARTIGSVNTVVNDEGRLTGYNTDWIGAVRALGEETALAGHRAAVVGAGGAARAVTYGLVREGCRVTVYNRTPAAGQAMAEDLGATFGGDLEALARLDPCEILVHATPVGFHAPEDSIVPPAALEPGRIVFDVVPLPLETRLLREARDTRCRTVPGVRMQIHQALHQFELYTGYKADFAVMEKALLDAMGAQAA